MAAGLALEPGYYVPCGLILAAVLAPRKTLPQSFRRPALAVAACALTLGVLTRLAVLLWSMHAQPLSPWNADIQAIAGAWLNGQPLYPSMADGYFYGSIYGPLLFEIVALAQRVFGIGSPLAGLPMALGELAAIAITWRTARRMGLPRNASAAAVGVMVVELSLLQLGGVRADQLLVLLAAVALMVAPSLARNPRSAFWLGLCGGFAMAFKFSALAYVVPALLPAIWRPGPEWRKILSWAAIGGGVGVLVPYVLPGAGFTPSAFGDLLIYWVTPATLSHNLLFSFMVLAPPLVWTSRSLSRETLKFLAGIVLAWVPIFAVASNHGAGPWHFAPFLPALSLSLAQAFVGSGPLNLRQLLLMSALATLVLIEADQQLPRTLNFREDDAHREARAEITRFLDAHPSDAVAIGSGWSGPHGTVDLGVFQPELPRTGHPLLFMEQIFVFTDYRSTADILIARLFRGCRVHYWINAPGPPFAAPFYGPKVQQEFLRRYRLVESTAELAIWECRAHAD